MYSGVNDENNQMQHDIIHTSKPGQKIAIVRAT